MNTLKATLIRNMSLPSRERGLKSYADRVIGYRSNVAPLAGARIEIPYCLPVLVQLHTSLPSRERGLKWIHPTQ